MGPIPRPLPSGRASGTGGSSGNPVGARPSPGACPAWEVPRAVPPRLCGEEPPDPPAPSAEATPTPGREEVGFEPQRMPRQEEKEDSHPPEGQPIVDPRELGPEIAERGGRGWRVGAERRPQDRRTGGPGGTHRHPQALLPGSGWCLLWAPVRLPRPSGGGVCLSVRSVLRAERGRAGRAVWDPVAHGRAVLSGVSQIAQLWNKIINM